MDPEPPRPGADPAGRTQPGPGTGHTYGIRGGVSSIVVKRPVHSRIFLSNCDGLRSAGTLWAFSAAKATGMYGGTERPTAQRPGHAYASVPQPRLLARPSADPSLPGRSQSLLTGARGLRAAEGPAAGALGVTGGPERRDGPPRGFWGRSRGAAGDAPRAEAQEAPDGGEHAAPWSPGRNPAGARDRAPGTPAPPRAAPRGAPDAQPESVVRPLGSRPPPPAGDPGRGLSRSPGAARERPDGGTTFLLGQLRAARFKGVS